MPVTRREISQKPFIDNILDIVARECMHLLSFAQSAASTRTA